MAPLVGLIGGGLRLLSDLLRLLVGLLGQLLGLGRGLLLDGAGGLRDLFCCVLGNRHCSVAYLLGCIVQALGELVCCLWPTLCYLRSACNWRYVEGVGVRGVLHIETN